MNSWLSPILVVLVTAAGFYGAYVETRPRESAAAELESAKSEPFITDADVASKNAAVTQCYAQQNVPLMGFGPSVVCVKKDAVVWIR